jgi:hypothetical protein
VHSLRATERLFSPSLVMRLFSMDSLVSSLFPVRELAIS